MMRKSALKTAAIGVAIGVAVGAAIVVVMVVVLIIVGSGWLCHCLSVSVWCLCLVVL